MIQPNEINDDLRLLVLKLKYLNERMNATSDEPKKKTQKKQKQQVQEIDCSWESIDKQLEEAQRLLKSIKG